MICQFKTTLENCMVLFSHHSNVIFFQRRNICFFLEREEKGKQIILHCHEKSTHLFRFSFSLNYLSLKNGFLQFFIAFHENHENCSKYFESKNKDALGNQIFAERLFLCFSAQFKNMQQKSER